MADKLNDITAQGLTSTGLPSTALKEVRQALENPPPPLKKQSPATPYCNAIETVKYRQHMAGNRPRKR